MRIAVKLKHPYDGIFGLKETEAEVPEGSRVQDVVDLLIEKHDAAEALKKNKLINEGKLAAFYALNKHVMGGKIVSNEKVLEESDTLTILGAFIGG